MEFLIIAGLMLLALGLLGGWISSQKYREPMEGFFLGLFFGPLGVLIAALLPTQPKPTLHSSHRRPIPSQPRKSRSLGTEWVPDFPEDEVPRVESSDGIDEQAFGFLTERREPKLDALGEAIARGLQRKSMEERNG